MTVWRWPIVNFNYRFEDDHPDPPSVDYAPPGNWPPSASPYFGCYNIPEFVTTELTTSPLVVGDAIDDIADIARDYRRRLVLITPAATTPSGISASASRPTGEGICAACSGTCNASKTTS